MRREISVGIVARNLSRVVQLRRGILGTGREVINRIGTAAGAGEPMKNVHRVPHQTRNLARRVDRLRKNLGFFGDVERDDTPVWNSVRSRDTGCRRPSKCRRFAPRNSLSRQTWAF